MADFVVWQRVVSPHMVALVNALVEGGAKATYVAEAVMSPERRQQGWSAPQLAENAQLMFAGNGRSAKAIASSSESAIHITQGIVRNGRVRHAIEEIRDRGLRWGVVMEAVDDRGPIGILKRLDYRLELRRGRKRPDFVLAIGDRTAQWTVERGMPAHTVFPFAYFLAPCGRAYSARRSGPFRLGFVGRLVKLKRVDLLIEALVHLRRGSFSPVIVGGGPLNGRLRELAESRLGRGTVRWIGRVPMERSRMEIADLDCLVLPSDYDGWGAVVSEALMAGVPAVCSDGCGSAAAVRASGVGGVFPAGDLGALSTLLAKMVDSGPLNEEGRANLSRWAMCLSSEEGARYLEAVVKCVYGGNERPPPPWIQAEGGHGTSSASVAERQRAQSMT